MELTGTRNSRRYIPKILKRKRKETEDERKRTEVKKKTKTSAKSIAVKGYLTKELLEKVKELKPEAKKKEMKKMAATIMEQYAKEARRSYQTFWKNHFETLERNGAQINKLKLHEKKPAIT